MEEKGRDEGKLADRMLGLALSDSHSHRPPPPPLSSSSSSSVSNNLLLLPLPPRDDDDHQRYHCYLNTNNNHNTFNPMDTTTTTTNNNNNDSLFQVMKAVQAAEATVKQQVEENTRLRTELQKKIQELGTYKSGEPRAQRSHSADEWNRHVYYESQSVPSLENQEYKAKYMCNTGSADPSSTQVLCHNLNNSSEHPTMQHHVESQSNSTKINGTLKVLPGGQAPSDDAGVSQLSSPSTKSFSPSRYQIQGEYDTQLNFSGYGLMQMSEVDNTSSLLKQDFALKIWEHEEEISQLRKHLTDYSIKEAQIRNEKYVLEKCIAYMHLAFDQQQQDLVDSASKSLSYRQGIIEENRHLTYALQAARQERTTIVSSLLSLLADYSLQPPVSDAQSIVSNVKVLFRHLQEKLILTKLNDSQYQLAPLQLDMNLSNLGSQQLSPTVGAPL